MMAAMMLPSLSPMAVAYSRDAGGRRARLARRGPSCSPPATSLAWAAFGLLAYALIEGVRSLDLGVLAWDRAGRYVAGGVILGAALYELTRDQGDAACGTVATLGLLSQRPGAAGALLMGLEQGGFCVGCSGGLMVALFALGVMSIAWMLLIAAPDRDREAAALDAGHDRDDSRGAGTAGGGRHRRPGPRPVADDPHVHVRTVTMSFRVAAGLGS